MTLTCPECEGSVAMAQAPRLSEITNCPDCLADTMLLVRPSREG